MNEMQTYNSTEVVSAKSVNTEMMISRQAQEVQAAMVVAKRFPRDEIEANNRILNACKRKSLAERAIYEYPRGGENVTGPSIRLAEVMAQNWGNLDFGITELEQKNGESTVMAYCWDLETNTRQTKIFTVPHIRYTKKGSVALTDPRDIYEMVANQQPDDLLKDEAVVAVGFFHDLLDVDTAVDQLAGDGDDMPLLVLFVADDVAHVGQACQHTGAIRVAQAALDTETLARLRVDVVVCQILFTQRPHGLRVQRRHFCMGIVHARISPFSYFSLIYFPSIHHDGTPL